VRLHPLRTALTCLGILLGVAMGVGVGLLNASTMASFNDMVHGLAGKSDFTVTVAGRGGMPVSKLDEVLAVAEVRAATPTVRVSGFLSDFPTETVMILGVDALADEEFRTLKVSNKPGFDPLSFLNSPDSILVSTTLAARHGIKEGDKLFVSTHGERMAFTVRAIVAEEGAAKVYSGNVLVVDVFGAEERLGRGGNIDQIDVIGKPGVPKERLQKALETALGEGTIVEQPGRNRQAENMVKGLEQTTNMLGVLSLFVGMFLIYNTFGTAVAQRRREIGILRALGTTRGQVIVIFLGEAAVLGLLGSALGVLAGAGLARLLIEDFARTISNFYFQVHTDVVTLSWPLFLRYMGMGTLAAVVSAVIPARRAAAISPLEALSGSALEASRAKNFRWAFAGGLVALGGETLILLASWEQSNISIGVLSALVSFIALALLSPMLIVVFTMVLRPFNKFLFGIEARLGGDNLTRATGRTAVTVSALMIGITLAIAMGGSFASLSQSLDEWITTGITADLSIRGSVDLPGVNSVSLPMNFEEELKKVPGVADVGTFRIAPVPIEGGNVIQIYGINTEVFRKYSKSRWTEGDRAVDGPPIEDGTHVLISENLSTKYNLHKGDTLTIIGPKGKEHFKISGVHVDYSSDLGAAMIHRKAFVRLFNDTNVDAFDLWLKPGVEPAAVRETVRAMFPGKQMYIQTNVEFRNEIHKAVNQIFALTDVIQLLVIVIAVIGIINTLLVSILDRTRELGVLRAVGFTREQISRLIIWEAGIMGFIAGVLGALSGSGFAMTIVHLINRQLVGWSTAFIFPTDVVIKGFFVAFLSAIAAGWYPARRASSLNIVEAMEYE
jgi:putative ABC transport system permease protein